MIDMLFIIHLLVGFLEAAPLLQLYIMTNLSHWRQKKGFDRPVWQPNQEMLVIQVCQNKHCKKDDSYGIHHTPTWVPFSVKSTLKNGYGFRGSSGTPPSKQNLSNPPPPESRFQKDIVRLFNDYMGHKLKIAQNVYVSLSAKSMVHVGQILKRWMKVTFVWKCFML